MKTAFRILLGLFFVGAGVNHFVRTDFYLRMMPPYVPFHLAMIQISGVAELALVVAVVPRAARPRHRGGSLTTGCRCKYPRILSSGSD